MRAMVCGLVWVMAMAGCGSDPLPAPRAFTLELAPALVFPTIPGQRCVLLARVVDADSNGVGGPATVSATVDGATLTVNPAGLDPGRVSEITVIPGADAVNTSIVVTVTAERGGLVQTAQATLEVSEGDIDELEASFGPPAADLRDRFVAWLETEHPELNITSQTEWTGAGVSPYILIVTHYLFFSEEWEMHVSWHVMIPPSDWGEIDLRRRFDELTPSVAYHIDSLDDATQEPYAVDPPDQVWR